MLLFDRLALVIFSILVPIIVNATATNPESKSEDGIERCKGTMAIVNLFTPRNSIGRVLSARNEQLQAITELRRDPKFENDRQKLEKKVLEANNQVPVGIYEESLKAGYIYLQDAIRFLEKRKASNVPEGKTETLISPQEANQALMTLNLGEVLTRVHNFLHMSPETKVSQVQLYSLISFVYRLNIAVKNLEKGSFAGSSHFDGLIENLKAHFPGFEEATKLARAYATEGYLIFPVPQTIRLGQEQKSFLRSARIIPYELADPTQDPFETPVDGHH